ncbi:hypothetical protein HF313_21255 [Massilia atriviolacea]|uniref:Uncharacterized protein n=1 Tax=Massilia atriviolacea TaxID=2495579 RepID=A0A430HRQ1_9BURK|nr:hypothetical protein [Massilia atriviolacea]RSZ60196.1 hypothetical protein EJB06_03440 [Massilia atriviolacea]
MAHLATFSPQLAPAQPAALRESAARSTGGGLFWSPGIGLGAGIVLELAADIDGLSQRIAQLPERAARGRPMVTQYLFMVKTLAAAWATRSRPGLHAALDGLRHLGDSLLAQDAPLLAPALLNMFHGRPSCGPGAVRLIDGLVRRLAAPAEALSALDQDVGSYLAQMGRASGELEADTVLATERLQADHVHAFILAQQVDSLQGRLAEARARRDSRWLQGPDDEAHEEIDKQSGALDSVMRQLDHIRAGQAAMAAEAVYLQGLLPTLSAYLSGMDRIGAGIRIAAAGTRALRAELDELKNVLLAGPAASATAHAQLETALPAWRLLTARIAAFAPAQAG